MRGIACFKVKVIKENLFCVCFLVISVRCNSQDVGLSMLVVCVCMIAVFGEGRCVGERTQICGFVHHPELDDVRKADDWCDE